MKFSTIFFDWGDTLSEIPFEFTKEDVAHRSVRGKHIELKVRPI